MLKELLAASLFIAFVASQDTQVDFCSDPNCLESSCEGESCNYCVEDSCCASRDCNSCINDCREGCSSRSCSLSCFNRCQSEDDSPRICEEEGCRSRAGCSYRNCDRKERRQEAVNILTNVKVDNRIDNVNTIHIPINVTSVNFNSINAEQGSAILQPVERQQSGQNCQTVVQNLVGQNCQNSQSYPRTVPQGNYVGQQLPVQRLPIYVARGRNLPCGNCQPGCQQGGCGNWALFGKK